MFNQNQSALLAILRIIIARVLADVDVISTLRYCPLAIASGAVFMVEGQAL